MSSAPKTSIGPLSPEQIRQFFDRGFTFIENLFSEAEIEEVRECFNRLQARAHSVTKPTMVNGSLFVVNDQVIDRIVWCGAAEPHLLQLSEDKRILEPCAQLLGTDAMEQLICQAHFKLPADGVNFEWHQDSEHRRYGSRFWSDVNGSGSYVQTFLAVDEMSQSNGPLLVIPNSSRWGHLDLNKRDYKIEFTPQDGIQVVTMKPGTLMLMGPYTVHASFPNESDQQRRLLINGYCVPGANQRKYPGQGAGRLLSVSQ